jgi:phosphoglycolate phosphatase-like HAD superfamily hydrolase
MPPFIVFDLDGTLALIEHRRHHVAGRAKNWRAFFAACGRDEPHKAVVLAFHAHRGAGHEVHIWSGRSDEVRRETEDWLMRYLDLDRGFVTTRLRMRRENDYTADDKLKKSWLDELRATGRDLDLVYDDRQKVVDMWRREGVPCFQVAPGDF